MSTGILIAIIVAVVLIALAIGVWMMIRRRQLRERFGAEYDRVVEAEGSRMAAERDLRAREQRHDDLDIKPLPSTTRQQYAQGWTSVQTRFLDTPEEAVGEADQLVARLMRERGYPTEGYEQQLEDLSVEHGRTLEHYRAAHAIKALTGRQATTEELRGAMVHYRVLFDDLLSDAEPPGEQRA
ncbi:hypothetical protein C8250_042315 [Streptomyces sp. So13.3]|uniref:hypothetical protein n=1 Tax=Streptomyces TaxID=1883 RepID=UPI00110732EF|nr:MULTISPECIES: hypothetical protein [Streptomyces]MCZ4103570.1 hypothetical protein [Streptomyces sp. H39-C1]QNA77540.1 hypothetical protein C8250_042315 [Streptomyces sp. So13.3]